MPTSVHIPRPLLEEVDRRARRARVSRNRFIVRALEKEVAREAEWSPGFFEELAHVDPDDRATVEEMTAAIRAARTGKPPPTL